MRKSIIGATCASLAVSSPVYSSLIGDTVTGCLAVDDIGDCNVFNSFTSPHTINSGDTAVVSESAVEFFSNSRPDFVNFTSTRADLTGNQITIEWELLQLNYGGSVAIKDVHWIFTDLNWTDYPGIIVDVLDLGGDFTIRDLSFTNDSVTIGTVASASFSSPTLLSHTFELVVSPVPIPAAAWLFGSGLIGLIGLARRKKA